MNERQCERCGKNITHKPHTIAEDVLGICSECAGDLDEFMNGAPVLKWNPIRHRPLTDKEKKQRKKFEEEGHEVENVGFEGLLPDDGTPIIISGNAFYDHDGNRTRDTMADTAYNDGHWLHWLASGYGWENVEAWAELPEPYIPDVEEEDK